MRENLPQQFVLLLNTMKSGRKKLLQALSVVVFVCCIIGQASAQDLKPEAQRQIDFLAKEKKSRTSVQKKIATNILLTYKLQNDLSMRSNLPDLKFDEIKINAGKIKVDITVAVSAQVLSALKALDCDIIFSSEKFASVTANVPLNKIEQIAALAAVKNIQLWMAPVHNNGEPFNIPAADTTVRPDFNERANNVKNFITDVVGQNKNNPAFPANNPVFTTNTLPGTGAGSVISEAVATHKADVVQANFGIKGAGIKIGVLSNGVDGYATSQASGDLPPVINILPGQAGSASEGRAMMELIHDIAPDAELYYATALISQANFAQNILNLRAAGCDIIVDDVSYYAEAVFQDDNVAQSINTVTASGALYFSSAGNSGNKNDGTAGVWEGDFIDGGPAPSPIGSANGNVNDFGGVLYNTITLNSGNPISLKWSDPLGQSANDYDLYAVNSTGTGVLTASTGTQDGTQNPYEVIAGVAVGSRIYVVKSSGDVRALHLNTNRSRLSVSTSGVTGGHNAALNAYCVAATPAAAPFYNNFPQGPYPNPFNAANVVEGFSSDGPRRMFFNPDGSEITPGNILFGTNGGILLQKPDITAADGNATNTPGFQPFYGTSAAAPNAAAIAALIKSAVPGITPAQVRTALTGSAIDIETAGIDRDAGAGIIMAPEALVAAGFSPSAPAFNLNTTTITEGSFSNSNGAVEPGETGNLVIRLLNNGATANGVQAVLSSNTPGVTITQSTGALGTINMAGEANNSASPFVFGLNASVACGGIIDFTLSVTYDGSSTPTVLTFTYKTGKTPAAIVATLGGAPASGSSFTSSSGIQTGRLFRNSIASTCAALKANPGISGTASIAYHAYTFTNTTTVSQCVDVTMASDGTKFHLAYNGNGFIPTAITTNYLADPGGSTNGVSVFRFQAPAGEPFTIVVNDVAGGTVNPYTLNVGLVTCSTPPACTPIDITNPGTKTVTVNTSYTETLVTTGGSGAYTYSVTNTLPAGLTLVGNTISGTPTEAGSYTVTVNAADAAGCTAGTVTYQLEVVEAPAITATGTFETFTACEGSVSPEQGFTVEGTNLTDNITVSAPAGFEVSSASGTGFGSSVMLTPTSGTVSTTTLYIVKAASAADNINGTISVTSAGATTQELTVNGVTNAATTWYLDSDGDGYGNPASSVQACEAPASYVANNNDCDDLTASTYPGAPELCDGVDNDCDGAIDEDFPLVTYYFDVDGDGYGSPVNPVQVRCFQPANTVTNNLDCDDQQASVYPGAPEVCDGMDNDCDGEIDEDFPLVAYYFDVDGDGYGSPVNPVYARCGVPINTVENSLDCNDQDASTYPGAPEVCDGADNDCDGFIDEDFPLITYYFDTDGDGYGNPNSPIQARCIVPIGTVSNNLDCDDNNTAVNPGATEICGNGIDDNCNGQVDENCTSNIRLNIPDKAKREGNGQRAINFIVKLNRASPQTVQVSYATQNITAVAGSDYVATSGTLTFAPGVRKQTITVVITGDRVAEPDETFRIILSNAVNAGIADNEAIGTIINDDGASLTATVAPATIVATTPTSLKVSPNPATTTLYVQLNGYKGNVTLQLRSIEGKVLIQEKLQAGNAKMTQQRMNVANLPNGTYLLTAIDEKGKVKTEKVIISRQYERMMIIKGSSMGLPFFIPENACKIYAI